MNFRRLALATTLAALASPAFAEPHRWPAAGEPCRTVRGRMEVTNGTPSVRIWIVGTKRILGVDEQDTTFDQLPANIRKTWTSRGELPGNRLYGDFTVCPLTRYHPGWMQIVSVKSGKNLRLETP